MQTLTLTFKIDNGSSGLNTPSLRLDKAIATGSIFLKRICVTTEGSHLQRLISVNLPFINHQLCNQGTEQGIIVPIPGSKTSVSYSCDEQFGIRNNEIPNKFDVKLHDVSADTNHSTTIPATHVSLIFETDGYGQI